MDALYALYTRIFPDYPVNESIFNELISDDSAKVFTSLNENGEVNGFAAVLGNTVSLLCVDEKYRRHGIGSSLLKQAEDEIRRSGGEKITLGQGSGYIFQGVPEEYPEAVPFFKKHGYSAEWSSVNMRIDLGSFDPDRLNIHPCPSDVSFRYAEEGDHDELIEAVASVNENWVKYFTRGNEPVLLAMRNGKIAGFEFVSAGDVKFAFPGEKSGSIGCVGVIPSEREQGIGLRMVAEGLRELKKSGCTMSELLYVALIDWYAQLGFVIMHRQWMGWKNL